jgi:hypothetical protein
MFRLLASQSESQSFSRILLICSRPALRRVSLRSSLIRSVVIVPLLFSSQRVATRVQFSQQHDDRSPWGCYRLGGSIPPLAISLLNQRVTTKLSGKNLKVVTKV